MSADAKSLPSWNTGDGCIPDQLLLAIYNDLLPEEDELRLFAHIAECSECDGRLGSLPEGARPTFLEQLRVAPCMTLAERDEFFREWQRRRVEGKKAVKAMKWPS